VEHDPSELSSAAFRLTQELDHKCVSCLQNI